MPRPYPAIQPITIRCSCSDSTLPLHGNARGFRPLRVHNQLTNSPLRSWRSQITCPRFGGGSFLGRAVGSGTSMKGTAVTLNFPQIGIRTGRLFEGPPVSCRVS